MTGEFITDKAEDITRLLGERLGIRGRTLAARVRRAGRLLPRAVAREARFLAQAAVIAPNPRLLRMIDPTRVDQAYRLVRDHLQGIDPRERRRTRLIGIAAVAVFNLIVLAALVLVVLRWRGLI